MLSFPKLQSHDKFDDRYEKSGIDLTYICDPLDAEPLSIEFFINGKKVSEGQRQPIEKINLLDDIFNSAYLSSNRQPKLCRLQLPEPFRDDHEGYQAGVLFQHSLCG